MKKKEMVKKASMDESLTGRYVVSGKRCSEYPGRHLVTE